jgi:predicted YcjX-like family ATPase
MMERRYEAYKAHVVKPFFRDHFARLDRQIVLIDALAALNAGPAAMRDLETALTDVLAAFRVGRSNLLSALFRPKIDKILFAATKADHLHHTSHDRLEAILRHLTKRAIARVESVGAEVEVIALSAVRATREGMVGAPDEPTLEAVIGTPLEGERIGDEIFDGLAEAAIYPGELPRDPDAVFRDEPRAAKPNEIDYRFVRFRPPVAVWGENGTVLPLPHIRLDRALQYLLGDRLG